MGGKEGAREGREVQKEGAREEGAGGRGGAMGLVPAVPAAGQMASSRFLLNFATSTSHLFIILKTNNNKQGADNCAQGAAWPPV